MFEQYLQETQYFNFNHPLVQEYTKAVVGQETDSVKQAIAIYYAVRDDVLYNPYTFSVDPKSFAASECLAAQQAYCIPKAVLMGAMARAVGIPSRLGLADVKNHLSSQQLVDYLRTDIFYMHGFIELYLNGQWVKATPAFNATLCTKMGVEPLEFDGRTDSIFQEYNADGTHYMDYIADHGTFSDVPVQLLFDTVKRVYGHLLGDVSSGQMAKHSLEKDIAGDNS